MSRFIVSRRYAINVNQIVYVNWQKPDVITQSDCVLVSFVGGTELKLIPTDTLDSEVIFMLKEMLDF